MLGLRTCDNDGKSYNDFQWPLEAGAVIEAPDWDPEPCCGGGLHFLPWGEGDAGLLDWSNDAKALVVRPLTKIVDIDGAKSKARKCKVVAVFDSIADAANYIAKNGGQGKAIAGVTATAGRWGTATAGDEGTATAGRWGTATAGDEGTATAGDKGTIICCRWDGNRMRYEVGYVGETLDADSNVLEPGTPYQLNDNGKFMKVVP